MKRIDFAGGCFWGVEAYFKLVQGVTDTTVGYVDGPTKNPTYDQVCAGSGHAEAVRVVYDERIVSLYTLLEHFFNIVDPTLKNRQGPDIGMQYRTGMYNFHERDDNVIAEYLKELRRKHTRPIHVDVKRDSPFYEAEEAHQDYLDKHENGYCHINLSSVKNVK